jgi:hypothetical protein
MSAGAKSDPTLDAAIQATLDAAIPGVGTLLSFVARRALALGDEARIQRHLQRAVEFETQPKDVARWKFISRAKNSVQTRQASRKNRTVVQTLEVRRTIEQRSASEKSSDAPSQYAQFSVALDRLRPAPFLLSLATYELRDAIEQSDVTTWTAHLSNGLVAHVRDSLKDQQSPAADCWARVVTGKASAKAADAKDLDLVSWAQAVSLRFETSLSGDEKMRDWVARLDRHDQNVVQLEMLRAARGARTALAILAVAAAGLSIELGVRYFL